MAPANDGSPAFSDTIAAIATAWGEAGIAIVRISGPFAVELAESVVRFGAGQGFPPPRVMRLASLTDESDCTIDQVLVVRFAAPKSYTGEDVVEIHTHGGTLVAQLCLEGLLRRGTRMAEPGEFTKRAFLNGRIDISQAEGVLGIIRSRSAEALRAAARTLSGELSSFVSDVREELLTLQSALEVGLDFPEEGIPYVRDEDLPGAIATLKLSLEDLQDRCSTGLLLREGIRVALTGRPNVGKSSLLNALLKQARAIVTALPGTTRDVIEEAITWRGVPIRLVDTAGLRVPSDDIEADGITRTNEELRKADIRVWILDGSAPMEDEDRAYIGRLGGKDHVVVLNKSDLPHATTEDDIRAISPESLVLSLSAKTGEGIDLLKECILTLALDSGAPDAGLNVTARQLAEVRDALAAIAEAEAASIERTGQDVVATLLAAARESLERLLGIACDDALLDSVFSRFCVGK
ncbi:MAG: tRNA uridine-5-carboxymethylaminomethyl(34) synthesis GTPase MnmE [Synergistaceae bacterium]|nr:tRNA uridine-5-carboxymethylaminomethyl(34) synthesis GTPase MnmE [Synergistaceae bacterium]